MSEIHDFNLKTSGDDINKAIAGKTILEFVDDYNYAGPESFIIIKFTDGTSLRMRYDYIYSWQLEASHD